MRINWIVNRISLPAKDNRYAFNAVFVFVPSLFAKLYAYLIFDEK